MQRKFKPEPELDEYDGSEQDEDSCGRVEAEPAADKTKQKNNRNL